MFEHCWEIKRFVLEVGVEAVNTICVLHLGEGASWPVFLLGLHHDIWAWWLTYSSRSLPVVQRLGVGVGWGVGENGWIGSLPSRPAGQPSGRLH